MFGKVHQRGDQILGFAKFCRIFSRQVRDVARNSGGRYNALKISHLLSFGAKNIIVKKVTKRRTSPRR